MKRFALAGNPNSGKTTLFNSLTGSNAYVGNWPGVTVEKKEGIYKKLEEEINIIDLPGIYSLSPYTSEEVISRNYLVDETPDCVINIIDATNLERNLYLTTQLLEINVPLVVAVNMIDELKLRGDKIDIKALEKELGVPVVEISALKQQNLDDLMKRAYDACKVERKGRTVIENKDLLHLISDTKIAFKGKGVDNPLFHAIKLIEQDELELNAHKDLKEMVESYKGWFNDQTFKNDFEAIIADARYKYITEKVIYVLTKNPRRGDTTRSDKIDKVLTNKFFALPFFLFVIFIVFHFTFSENLFFLGSLFENIAPSFEGTMFEGLLWTSGGINSPGVIATNFLTSILDTLSEAMANLLIKINVSQLLQGFLIEGVLGGLFAILGFLPQILCLFLFFSILEDSGYMARVAFILDRILRRFGLSGRAFIPMIMGFGCSVPAIINTRTLSDDNEKIATIRVIPFFSCGAKLPILLAISGAILECFHVGNIDLITYGMYLLGMLTAFVSVLIMKKTSLKGSVPPFIMELPSYHLPQFKSLMLHLWDKAKHFVKKAFTIILASTIIVWVLQHVSWQWEFVENEEMNLSILASIGQFIQPLFTPLGFGSQLSSSGWVFAVAALTGLIAKENVISTFGALAVAIGASYHINSANLSGIEGLEETAAIITATGITIPGLLAFIAFNMTTIPCFAAVATAKAELPKNRFKSTIIFWIITSFIVASTIYIIGSYWWTIFFYIALIVFIILVYNVIVDKKRKKAM